MIASGMGGDDLVIERFADRVVEFEERVRLTDSYREALQVALAELAARNREVETARRRIAALIVELREVRRAVAA